MTYKSKGLYRAAGGGAVRLFYFLQEIFKKVLTAPKMHGTIGPQLVDANSQDPPVFPHRQIRADQHGVRHRRGRAGQIMGHAALLR